MFRPFTSLIVTLVILCLTACQKTETHQFAWVIGAHGAAPDSTTIVIKRLSDNKLWTSNPSRAETRFIPASTSKIPHTLIALETKLAAPETLFKWDGRKRTFKSWNQDQSLLQAYRRSAVWVYQEMTQSLGPETMRDWLAQFEYGNHDIGADDNVSQYWLTGPLEISAQEQVNFLTKLATKELPLSPNTYAQARPMFINEIKISHTLFAKTGWMYDETAMDIGWFVGWVETAEPSEIYVFALNMDMPQQGDQKKRKPIVMSALKSIGAWPDE